MESHNSISIIIPAYNEEMTIGKVLDEIPQRALESEGYQVDILVVDNSSSDGSGDIARGKGARVIVEPRRGKGRAVRAGLREAEADFIFILDADYTYPATSITEMLRVLKDSPVVIGSRLNKQREKGAISWLNLVGNHLLTWIANRLYRSRISDLCTGYWGFRKDVLMDLNLVTNGFQLEAEMFTELARKGIEIAEVPIGYRKREGEAKLARIRDGLKIFYILIAKRLRRQS